MQSRVNDERSHRVYQKRCNRTSECPGTCTQYLMHGISSFTVANTRRLILIYMMVLCTQVNKMYVIATLSVYPHRASLKNMPGHGGIRTYDLWNASPMLCQLSYAVRSVRVYDISELSLVPSNQCNLII